MIFPVIYAVVLWFLAARFRRMWQGILIVSIAIGLLALLGTTAIEHEDRWIIGPRASRMPEWWRYGSKQLLILLIPYTILVGGVAVFLVSLPRPRLKMSCRKCSYDLSGLNPLGLVCPECGAEQGPHHCRACGHDLRGQNPLGLICPNCASPWKGLGSGREDEPEQLTPILRKPPPRRSKQA